MHSWVGWGGVEMLTFVRTCNASACYVTSWVGWGGVGMLTFVRTCNTSACYVTSWVGWGGWGFYPAGMINKYIYIFFFFQDITHIVVFVFTAWAIICDPLWGCCCHVVSSRVRGNVGITCNTRSRPDRVTPTKTDRFWCAPNLWTFWCQRLENETKHGGKEFQILKELSFFPSFFSGEWFGENWSHVGQTHVQLKGKKIARVFNTKIVVIYRPWC